MKYLAFAFLLIGIVGAFLIFRNLNLSSSWNYQRASFLAKRVYLDPTQDDVNQFLKAGSAKAALDLAFSSPSTDEENKYQQGLKNLEAKKDTFKTDPAYQETYYTYQLIHDPDRARRKLYYMLENIFSVDASEKDDGITYPDVQKLDQTLYQGAYGNYLQLVEDARTNYAMARYLNLTDSKKDDPNENLARELMQLFLVGPFTPLDHQQASPNYTDQDVNSLAYILTGYQVDKKDRTIFLNSAQHFNGQKMFLGQQTNDPVNIVNYIISKRRTEATEFLANKLLHFYITDNPTDADIQAVAEMVNKNNFELQPTIKELLSSDIMFRPQYINEDRFKSPVELVASFYTNLYGRNNYSLIPSNTILADLDFKPYEPGSIFGRDGFNQNSLFYSGTIIDKWIGDSHKLVMKDRQAIFDHLRLSNNSDQIQALESNLYLGEDMPEEVRSNLKTMLSKNPNANMVNVLSLMLAQPEFITLSGNTQAQNLASQNTNTTNSQPQKLIVVRIKGGYDYQGLVANQSDPAYTQNRKQMALNSSNSTPLGNGYVLNNAASSLLPLIKSKEAFFVSAVGLPNHSRAHDVASKQMETGLLDEGILAKLSQQENNINLISFTNTPPVMLKGAPSLQIGTSSLALYPEGKNGSSSLEAALKNTYNQRKFPAALANYYSQSLMLDQLATDNIAGGGKGTPGGKNETQLPFLEGLIDKNVGNTYYLYADNSYDMHAHEDENFDKDSKSLVDSVVKFYNDEKVKNKVTVVIFSEFGRTDKINGSNGTDHGMGGGMIILSNNLHLPTMVGSLTPSKDQHNWTDVKVDERDVWATIFNQLYNLPQDKVFGRNNLLSSYQETIQ